MAITNLFNYSKPAGMKAPNINLDRLTKGGQPSAQPSSKMPDAPTKDYGMADKYLEQKVMAAKPEELTLMLYDGIIKFLNQVKIYNDQKSIEKSHNANIRAQDIISELRATLDMNIEMSNSLDSVYEFMIYRLFEANREKSNPMIDEVLELARELRDTWKQAFNL